MSTDSQPSAVAPSATARKVSSPPGKRRLDRIDEPARPLGPKRAALQLRRQRNGAPTVATKSQSTSQGTQALVSQDGSVGFVLRASLNGLLIERTLWQAIGARLVQCMVFGNPGTFDRWCESEPMRFEDPVLYDRLRRDGHEALGGKR